MTFNARHIEAVVSSTGFQRVARKSLLSSLAGGLLRTEVATSWVVLAKLEAFSFRVIQSFPGISRLDNKNPCHPTMVVLSSAC